VLKGTKLREVIEFAIATERLGARFYAMLAERFREDREMGDVFARLARDEEAHEKSFSSLLEGIPLKESEGTGIGYEVLKAWSISEFFSNREGLMANLAAIRTRADAVQRALELEKATLGYYRALRDVMGEHPKLDAIIEAEKGHVVSLGRLL